MLRILLNSLKFVKKIDKDIDIMLEAKKKDLALFDLADSIKALRKNWKWIDTSTFEL